MKQPLGYATVVYCPNATWAPLLAEEYRIDKLESFVEELFHPTSNLLLKQKIQTDVNDKLIKQKYKQTNYYSCISKQVPLLQTGKNVRGSFKQVVRKQK